MPSVACPNPFPMSRPLTRLIPWVIASLFSFWLFTILLAPDFDPRPWFRHWGQPFHHLHRSQSGAASKRAQSVREAFLHAYRGYRDYAFPFDELLPVSGGRVNKYVMHSVYVSRASEEDILDLASTDGALPCSILWTPCGSWIYTDRLEKLLGLRRIQRSS